MLALPKTTEFNKRIPKQKFYENLTVTPALKRAFVEQIRLIWWRNKIALATANLAPGKSVTEVEVLELRLNQPSLDEAVLRQIDREIPYHILFLLEHAGKYQAWIGYKEAASGSAAFQVRQYYHTGWMEPERLPIRMEGITVDAVYENFVRQVAGDSLAPSGGEAPAGFCGAGPPAAAAPEADRGAGEQDQEGKATQPAGGVECGVKEVEKGDT